jgi:hypothetical protein
MRKILTVTPSVIVWFAGTACACRIIQLQAVIQEHGTINSSSLTPWMITFWALTVAQNAITSGSYLQHSCAPPGTHFALGLLIWKLYSVEKYNRSFEYREGPYGSGRLTSLMQITAGSGLLYTVTVLVALVCQAVKSNAIYPVSGIVRS